MLTLAFYRGSGTTTDRVIRWVTRSPFSHVEMLERPPTWHGSGAWQGRAWSASSRDGGVRGKTIVFEQVRWAFLAVPWAPEGALDVVRAEVGKPYDFAGLIGSQLFNLRRQADGRWFCSELCAHALGFAAPQELSPGGLFWRVQEMTAVYQLGLTRAGEPPEE